MIGLAIAAAALQSVEFDTPSMPAMTDGEACAFLSRIADVIMAEAPEEADTHMDGFSVECGRKSVSFDASVPAPLSALPAYWREAAQRRWNDYICNGGSYQMLVRQGWRFTKHISFGGGERMTIDAGCRHRPGEKPQ